MAAFGDFIEAASFRSTSKIIRGLYIGPTDEVMEEDGIFLFIHQKVDLLNVKVVPG